MTAREDGGATPLLLTLLLVLLFGAFAPQVGAIVCNYCASKDKELTPVLRRQLSSQRDTFYWPIDAASHKCHLQANDKNEDLLAQVCVAPYCITLSPNVPDVNFTVRGCMDQILRHPLKIDARLQKKGCFLRRSKPLYTGEPTINYLLCVCDSEMCNSAAQKPYFSLDEGTEDIIELEEVRRDQPILDSNGNSQGSNGYKPVSAVSPVHAKVCWSSLASIMLFAVLTRALV